MVCSVVQVLSFLVDTLSSLFPVDSWASRSTQKLNSVFLLQVSQVCLAVSCSALRCTCWLLHSLSNWPIWHYKMYLVSVKIWRDFVAAQLHLSLLSAFSHSFDINCDFHRHLKLALFLKSILPTGATWLEHLVVLHLILLYATIMIRIEGVTGAKNFPRSAELPTLVWGNEDRR